MKIHLVEAELFHADGQTDGRTDINNEANSRSAQFGNAPENYFFGLSTRFAQNTVWGSRS